MFIILRLRTKFKQLKIKKFIWLLFAGLAGGTQAQQLIKGLVVENDRPLISC